MTGSSAAPARTGRRRWPGLISDGRHGPLPLLLLGLTLLTGVVDAVSILALGRVFVANMTGNVVFVGFGLAGAPGFSLAASLSALAGFLVGAAGGGWLIERMGDDRAVLLRHGVIGELTLVAAALLVSVAGGSPLGYSLRVVMAALLAVAMGLQNAVARRLAVPDLTTTVLTMTLTGLVADLRAGERRAAVVRRLLAVVTMLAGGVAGAELVLHAGVSPACALAVALLVVVGTGAVLAARRPGGWRETG